MKQTIEIEVPEGKKAVWKEGKVMFENLKPKLPKTWEEFCEHNEVNINIPMGHLALMQLHQLRDCYRQGWTPNWNNKNEERYSILHNTIHYIITDTTIASKFLTFQSVKIAREFLDNFRDLIEQAGDLI